MTILDVIKERRSIRSFIDKDIDRETVLEIIEAGSFAPSGHNNQPWRFAIIKDKSFKEEVSKLTLYHKIVRDANVLIVVFLDKENSYDRDKDLMAIGACIQNMLLYAYEKGIGTVWLGEILKNKEKLRQMLGVSEEKEVMAVIAMGYPQKKPPFPGRKGISELVCKMI